MTHGAGTEEIRAAVDASSGPSGGELTCRPLPHHAVASATAGLWRFAGGDWSIVLKVLRHGSGGSPNWQAGTDTDDWYYWRREALVYSSGLIDHFDGPLRAPRCYGVFERPDGSIGLWLEDLGHLPPTARWAIDEYRKTSYALGQAQGAPGRLPSHRWLAHHWLRRYVERRASFMAYLDDERSWRLPLVARHLPADLASGVRDIWADRERLLGVVEAAPPTLCHLDMHPANIFSADGDTVLIDWAFAGIGALGEDPGNLVCDAVFDFFVPPQQFGSLVDAVFDGYLDGLAASGWSGDPKAVIRTMRAAAAVKYFWIVPAMLNAAASGRETLNGRPLEETFSCWAPIAGELIGFAREV